MLVDQPICWCLQAERFKHMQQQLASFASLNGSHPADSQCCALLHA
jgi:hypothetical protein